MAGTTDQCFTTTAIVPWSSPLEAGPHRAEASSVQRSARSRAELTRLFDGASAL